VTRRTQGIVLTLFGAVCLRLAVTDVYLRYVNEWMRWPLLLTAAGCLVLAAHTVVRGDDEGSPVAPRAAWLMLLPVVAVFVVSPPALGSYAAERNAVAVAPEEDRGGLDPSESAVAMPLGEFQSRAQWDDTLRGHRVALTGFVTSNQAGQWFVTRLAISCCAADAVAYRVRVQGVAAPAREAWVRVVGAWQRPEGDELPRMAVPVLLADHVERVPAPRNTYE
jgi:uncharacterized repeat protein (TIGR03943 family)